MKRETPTTRLPLAAGRLSFIAFRLLTRIPSGMHFRHRPRKRVIAVTSFVVGTAALVVASTGMTLGLSGSQSTSAPESFSSGTVTLANSSIASCPVSNMFPGQDNFSNPCTFSATYSGTTSAYLAVDVLIESQAGSGGNPLYDGTATGLQVQINSTNPTVTYSVPTTLTSCPGSSPVGSSCYELDDELISIGPYVTTSTVNFRVEVSLPASSSSAYQNGTAQIILTTHAVQSGNNALSCTTPAAAGSPCSPSGTFKWS